MKKVITIHKNIGETPLEALERTRKIEGIDRSVPMTYAGRLDPAAEGVLLILVGEECKNKESYLGLDKEYKIEILFGIETDTQDCLGLITRINVDQNFIQLNEYTEQTTYTNYIGTFNQKYPSFSSKTVDGRPLHEITRAGDTVEDMPTKNVTIYSIEQLSERTITGHDIALHALEITSKVSGDFRQKEIGDEWYEFGKEFAQFPFKIITLLVSCSSGTYMRSLAEKIGKDAGTGACAYSILRTKILKLLIFCVFSINAVSLSFCAI